MIIDSEIVEKYLAGDGIDKYKDKWYYKIDGIGYKMPNYNYENRKKVEKCYYALINELKDFVPCNVSIWDSIFPNWRRIIVNVNVNLIVGFPAPYDAVTEKDPDGITNIIFDMSQWAQYMDNNDIRDIACNLITHELCHVCIENIIPEIMCDTDDYIRKLDSATFNEGFAHLLSYEASDIDDVNWNEDKLKSVSEKSCNVMKKALSTRDKIEQDMYLKNAVCGSNYYDKFACMCGMFYLAKSYEEGGLKQLKEVFDRGYKGFAGRTVNNIAALN